MATPMVASVLTYELGVQGAATSTLEDMCRALKVCLAGVGKAARPVTPAAWWLGDDFLTCTSRPGNSMHGLGCGAHGPGASVPWSPRRGPT